MGLRRQGMLRRRRRTARSSHCCHRPSFKGIHESVDPLLRVAERAAFAEETSSRNKLLAHSIGLLLVLATALTAVLRPGASLPIVL